MAAAPAAPGPPTRRAGGALARARRCLAAAGPRRRAGAGWPVAAARVRPAAPAAPAAVAVRAIRGATTAAGDEPQAVWAATRELLVAIVERNGLTPAELISVLFTVTPDLTRAFPARAAGELGWADVPLLCALEIPVPGALPRCVRVLVHAATDRPRAAVAHVYLNGAVALRPDLAAAGPPAPPPGSGARRDHA